MTTNTATPAADTGLPKLQECHTRWIEIEGLIAVADLATNDINEHDREQALISVLAVTRRLSEEFGRRFSEAVVELGGNA